MMENNKDVINLDTDMIIKMINSSLAKVMQVTRFNLSDLRKIVSTIVESSEWMDENENRIDVIYDKISNAVSRELSYRVLSEKLESVVDEHFRDGNNMHGIVDKVVETINGLYGEEILTKDDVAPFLDRISGQIEDESDPRQVKYTIYNDLIVPVINTALSHKMLLNMRLAYDNNELVRILSRSYISTREIKYTYQMMKVYPDWRLVFSSAEEFINYIISRIKEIVVESYVLPYIPKGTLSKDEIINAIVSNTIVDFHLLSNEQLLEILEELFKNKNTVSMVKGSIEAINMLLQELSKRILNEEQRKRFTNILKEMLDVVDVNDRHSNDVAEVMKSSIYVNLHNIELDEELIENLKRAFSEDFADVIYMSKVKEIREVDPEKALEIIANVNNPLRYKELINETINLLMDIKISEMSSYVNGDKFIDYRRTIVQTIKNIGIPKIMKKEKEKVFGRFVGVLDASGSMFTSIRREKDWTQIKIGLLTLYIFANAVKQVTGQDYKLYIFADNYIDITEMPLHVIMDMVENPSRLSDVLGGGTELEAMLKKLSKVVDSEDNVFLISDTGDANVSETTLKILKRKTKSIAVFCPDSYFNETAKVFEKAGIPVNSYNSFSELFKKMREVYPKDYYI